jgi:hypothetical protein
LALALGFSFGASLTRTVYPAINAPGGGAVLAWPDRTILNCWPTLPSCTCWFPTSNGLVAVIRFANDAVNAPESVLMTT